tara:strand:- start:10 stop:537 length:528 start_codon:yes stop_codon:yes gene_type:complete
MARTLTVKKGNGASIYSPGWHEVTISKALYGDWNGTKFLDICFEGYAEKMNARIYEKMGQDGEEFAIGQVFRFANAGITDALESADGSTTIKMNDEPSELIGKTVNIFLYKDGEYSRVLKQVAPVAFSNIVEEFKDEDVEYWKGRAEKFFVDFIEPKIQQTETTDDVTADIETPF